jgi:hypothetical protein
MNRIYKISCLSLLSVMAACAPAGYYDSNGEYRSYGQSDGFRNEHAMAGTPDINNHPADTVYIPDNHVSYYDNDHHYTEEDSGIRIPRESFPPRGMCRVWFTDRPASSQPPVESCNDIRSRVPNGAYVIYGQ